MFFLIENKCSKFNCLGCISLLHGSPKNLKQTCGIMGSKNVNFSPIYVLSEELDHKSLTNGIYYTFL